MKKIITEAIGDAVNSQLNEAFNEGYDAAANICVGTITKKIDELFSKIDSASSLSKQEQFMLLKLKELKSETEEELRGFWSGNE